MIFLRGAAGSVVQVAVFDAAVDRRWTRCGLSRPPTDQAGVDRGDGDAAECYARIASRRDDLGRPISMADVQIAAICRQHAACLETRNAKDFDDPGVMVLDPWHART